MNQPDILKNLKKKYKEIRSWFAEKIWYSKTTGKTFAKRFKLFTILCIIFVAISKILYLKGITIPNVELIIPTLVVVGGFTMHTGASEKWSKINKHFGAIALISVFVIDLVVWGPRYIYLFTWPAFITVWLLAKKRKLSFRDSFSEIVSDATLTTAFLILFYDVSTAFGTFLLWWPLSPDSLLKVYLGQIPFTLYHLGSLFFVPPLVALGKIMTRVKIKAAVPIKSEIKEKETI